MSLADNHFEKSPLAKLDYTVSWIDWLAPGETISSATYTIQTGLTEDTNLRSHTTTASTTWVSGGSVGTRYALLYKIVTSDGREDARTIYLTIVNT